VRTDACRFRLQARLPCRCGLSWGDSLAGGSDVRAVYMRLTRWLVGLRGTYSRQAAPELLGVAEPAPKDPRSRRAVGTPVASPLCALANCDVGPSRSAPLTLLTLAPAAPRLNDSRRARRCLARSAAHRQRRRLHSPHHVASLRGRIDHLILPRDDGRQDLLLFALRHLEVVERAGDLRSDLVELRGRDVQILMRFA
jgi:hypothetical protein